MADERRRWSAKGGASRSNASRARKQYGNVLSSADLQGLLSVVLKGVIAGRFEPGVATAAANVARAIVAVKQATELEARICELEAAAGFRDPGKLA